MDGVEIIEIFVKKKNNNNKKKGKKWAWRLPFKFF